MGLGLKLWRGRYEDLESTWLRWVDADGNPIPTGAERADEEKRRADEEKRRAERLDEQLRKLGVEPEA